ncbi:MAG TPA: hypothetical protein VFL57_16975 [Bryobacteraceae bacterium]|nr:hypothetical protein [Bryobacteraceae bacterium]
MISAGFQRADSTITVERALARLFMDEALQKRMRLLMRYLAAAARAADKARKHLEAVIAERKCKEERLVN